MKFSRLRLSGFKSFVDPTELHIEPGLTGIVGPNGCGKSTLINMISGLVPIDKGEILFDGKSLKDTKIGYVFQNYREALFPWMQIERAHV